MADAVLRDKDIREPLFDFLEERYGKIRILEEKIMGRSRADMIMVTERGLFGMEIKSDVDTYARLGTQVKDYDAFFDFNYVVAGASHGLHVREHVPEHWGIITVEMVEGTPDFYVMREPSRNPSRGLDRQISLLWRRELAHIQEINSIPAYTWKSKRFVAEKILALVPAVLPEEELSRQICEELFERDYTTIREEINAFREEHGKKKRRTLKTAVRRKVRRKRKEAGK